MDLRHSCAYKLQAILTLSPTEGTGTWEGLEHLCFMRTASEWKQTTCDSCWGHQASGTSWPDTPHIPLSLRPAGSNSAHWLKGCVSCRPQASRKQKQKPKPTKLKHPPKQKTTTKTTSQKPPNPQKYNQNQNQPNKKTCIDSSFRPLLSECSFNHVTIWGKKKLIWYVQKLKLKKPRCWMVAGHAGCESNFHILSLSSLAVVPPPRPQWTPEDPGAHFQI